MTTKQKLDAETVRNACETLVAQGDQVTNRKVLELIGFGGMQTINRYVREWQHEQAAPERLAGVPEHFRTAACSLILNTWDAANMVMERESEVLRGQLARQQLSHDAAIAELQSVADQAQDDWQRRHDELADRLAEAAELACSLSATQAEDHARIDAQEVENTELRQRVSELTDMCQQHEDAIATGLTREAALKDELKHMAAPLHAESAKNEMLEATLEDRETQIARLSDERDAARVRLMDMQDTHRQETRDLIDARDSWRTRAEKSEREAAVLVERVRAGHERQVTDQALLDLLFRGDPETQELRSVDLRKHDSRKALA